MKRIIEKCRYENNAPNDAVKLRLRGQGSGFKEGHLKRESSEPLHLCVSSLYYDKFLIACGEAEKLMKKIYSDNDYFCRKRSKKPAHLKIKKVQNVPVQALNACLLNEDSQFIPTC